RSLSASAASCGSNGSGKAPARSSERSSPARWSGGARACWPGALPGGAPWQAGNVAADPTREFEAHRGRLFGLAYRLLGSAADARDVGQAAFSRGTAADPAATAARGAGLARVVTTLCLTLMSAPRAQREASAGPGLPEPVLTADGALGPLERVQQRE